MSYTTIPSSGVPASIILSGEPGPKVTSTELTMDMRRYRAQSNSMLYYEPDPSDFIASPFKEGRVNVDYEVVNDLVHSLKLIGSIMHDMAGLPILDWTQAHYDQYPAMIPTRFLNRIAIRRPPAICSIAYANDQSVYKPDMLPGEAVAWFRSIQQAGLNTISWIKDAAVHIALSDENSGWHITREHLERLPRRYNFQIDRLWKIIEEMKSIKENNRNFDAFDPAKPTTWCSPWYLAAKPDDPHPFTLYTTVLPRDLKLIDIVQKNAHTFYQLSRLPPLNSTDFDTCSTLSSEEDLYCPSPPGRDINLPHLHINPALLQAVVGYAQTRLAADADADAQSDSAQSLVEDDDISTMGIPPLSDLPNLRTNSPSELGYPSEDESSEEGYYNKGPQVGREYLDDWYYYGLKSRYRCPSPCQEGKREKEDALKGGARQEEEGYNQSSTKKIIAVEIQGLAGNEYSFECSFKLTPNIEPKWA